MFPWKRRVALNPAHNPGFPRIMKMPHVKEAFFKVSFLS
jgi:hypothetical protein